MLPPPTDLSAPVGGLILQLEHHVGTRVVVDVALDLLGGAERAAYAGELVYLTGHAGDHASWPAYWSRVWGARTLLHVWEDRAGPAVVAGVDDDAWRVAEMCLKVAVRRELADAVEGAVTLAGHDLPRVRGQAARLLGVVGEHEHLPVVDGLREDPDPSVRRHTALALDRLHHRLDPPDRVAAVDRPSPGRTTPMGGRQADRQPAAGAGRQASIEDMSP